MARNVARSRAAAAVCGLLAAIPAAAQTAPAPPEYYYDCNRYTTQVGTDRGGALSLSKSFNEDGSVYTFQVRWEDSLGYPIRKVDPNDSAYVELDWPGSNIYADHDAPFDWSKGSIKASYSPAGRNRFVFRKDEIGSQMVVDRNHGLRVNQDRNGDRYLFLIGPDLVLASQPEPRSGPGYLWTSLDSLIGWGADGSSVTVHDTRLLKQRRQSRDDLPYNAHRIFASYELDVPALVRLIAVIRAETAAWEKTLGDFRTACRRQVKETGEIVVT